MTRHSAGRYTGEYISFLEQKIADLEERLEALGRKTAPPEDEQPDEGEDLDFFELGSEARDHFERLVRDGMVGMKRAQLLTWSEIYNTDDPEIPGGRMLFPKDAWNFLLGASPLDGCWIGDWHPDRQGKYWWRSVIRKMIREV